MSERLELKCFLEDSDGLVRGRLIVEDGEFYGLWTNDDLRDDLDGFDDVIGEFGDSYYVAKADFKAGRASCLKTWFDKAVKDTAPSLPEKP